MHKDTQKLLQLCYSCPTPYVYFCPLVTLHLIPLTLNYFHWEHPGISLYYYLHYLVLEFILWQRQRTDIQQGPLPLHPGINSIDAFFPKCFFFFFGLGEYSWEKKHDINMFPKNFKKNMPLLLVHCISLTYKEKFKQKQCYLNRSKVLWVRIFIN